MLKLIFSALSLLPFINIIQCTRPLNLGDEPKSVTNLYPLQSSDSSYRLPTDTKPITYLIFLDIKDFEENAKLEFDGFATIIIKIVNDTKKIVLHTSNNFTDVSLFNEDNEEIKINVTYDAVREFGILTTNKALTASSIFTLKFSYSGKINDGSVRGIYRGRYAENNKIFYFLATHMQPVYARQVFPCYDEPQFKAVFRFTIINNNKYKVISNMLRNQVLELPGNKTITSFHETPLISTYILGFVISEFGSKQDEKRSVTYEAFARKSQIGNLDFGIKTAMKAMHEFEYAFDIEYALDHLNQVALPVFNFGGMENYGIIFYREDFLLYEAGVTTAYSKEYAAATIVHEVCHMFIGNLLTPYWWSVLWISEGFCRFYEYYMTKSLYPDMRMEELFALEALQPALSRDSSLNTHPLTNDVNDPRQIASMFSSITYSKGGSIVRMFLYSLTEDIFHRGLAIYLSKKTSNEEGIAKPIHIYEALQKALPNNTAIKVEEYFKTWEHETGYPILYVNRSYNSRDVIFTQHKFTDDIDSGVNSQSLWYIPITYSSKDNPNNDTSAKFWINATRTFTEKFLEVGPFSYLIINTNQVGFYRVMYDEANWMLIADELCNGNYLSISPNTRAMLIDDSGTFFDKKILNVQLFLEIIKYLERETDYIPWIAATDNLIFMRRMLDDGSSELYHKFRQFLRKILKAVYMKYGVEDIISEPHHYKHIRNIAINWGCQAHLEECVDGTRKKFDEFRNNRLRISNDHRSTIMCNGVLLGGEDEFNYLWSLFEKENDSSERLLLLRTIGCIENENVIREFILKYNNTRVTGSEWLTIIQSVYANGHIGMKVAVSFLDLEFYNFYAFTRGRLASLNSIFTGIGNRVVTTSMYQDVKHLMGQYEIPDVTQNSIITTMENNLLWLHTYSGDILRFLNNSTSIRASWIIMMVALIALFLARV